VGDFLNGVLKLIGGITVLGGMSAGFAYFLFRTFTTKWIEWRFFEQLEHFKHRQNQEIEHLRFRINTHFDRMTKLHQHEFDVLPEIWALANSTFIALSALTSSFGIDPDLDRMREGQFREFVEEADLSKWEKDDLINLSSGRTAYYREHRWYKDLFEAKRTWRKYHESITNSVIFIEEELSGILMKLDGIFTEILIKEELNTISGSRRDGGVASQQRLSEGKTALGSAGSLIRGRLWSGQSVVEDGYVPASR
jgi:hypothetical protein